MKPPKHAPGEATVAAVVERGRAAWDTGRPSLVWRVMSVGGMLGDEPLNDALDLLLGQGWVLQHMALSHNTSGLNSEVALFVFARGAGNSVS